MDIRLSKLNSNRLYFLKGKKVIAIAILKIHVSIWIK